MPYINPKTRSVFEPDVEPITEGQLNYMIMRIIDRFMASHPKMTYAVINKVIGVLECAKLELYRRIAGPYEDKKKEENGDVFTVKG
jgi:hypothetical protein